MLALERTYQGRPEGRRNLPLLQRLPVSGAEESVLPDVPLHPQTLFGLPHEQLRRKDAIVSALPPTRRAGGP